MSGTKKNTDTPKKAPKPEKAPKPAARPARRSHLEIRFAREWAGQGGPKLAEEFAFHPTRRWRSDFAHPATRTLIEVEGGAWGGRHTRGKGFSEDLQKYLTAHLHGWEVVRVGAEQVRGDIIAAMIGRLREKMADAGGCGERKTLTTAPLDAGSPVAGLEGGGLGW